LDSFLEVEPSIPVIKLPHLEVSTIPGLKFFSYLVTTASPGLTQGHYVKMVGGISARGDVGVSYMAGGPVVCSMYLQEAGDDPSPAENRYLYYRWWSKDPLFLQGGRFVQVVRLEPQFWRTVTLQQGDASAAATAGFQQALAYPRSVGMWCKGDMSAGADMSGKRCLAPMTSAPCSILRSRCSILRYVIGSRPHLAQNKRMRRAHHRVNKLSLSRNL
jgi:hypothetical protein